MSLFVRVNTNFYSHRKTARLRAKIGDAAFWLPPRLWAYAAENQPDGNFDGYTADELAAHLGYTGNPKGMLQAMLQAGFMDDNPLRIHDWAEYNSYHATFHERAKKAAAARWSKQSLPTPLSEKRGEETSIACGMLEASPPRKPGRERRRKKQPRTTKDAALVATGRPPEPEQENHEPQAATEVVKRLMAGGWDKAAGL